MRVVVDMQGAQGASSKRGIGRYTREFALEIARTRGDIDLHVLLNGAFPESAIELRRSFANVMPPRNIHMWQPPSDIRGLDPKRGDMRFAAELMREAVLRRISPDVVHVMSPFEGYSDDIAFGVHDESRTYVTTAMIYDLIPLEFPDEFLNSDPRFSSFYQRQLDQLRTVDGFLCISESSVAEAKKHLGSNHWRGVNVSAGVNPIFGQTGARSRRTQSTLQALGIGQPYVLYFGGFDPRKNVLRLIEAFGRLTTTVRAGRKLVLAGWLAAHFEEPILRAIRENSIPEEDVIFTGHVDDTQASDLMAACDLFVFPSVHEGFGLPVLEAMTSGARVIAAGTSSLPEVVGWTDALFDPLSVDDIAEKIQRGVTDATFRKQLLRNGREQSRNFTWQKTARLAMSFWADLVAQGVRGTAERLESHEAAGATGMTHVSPVATDIASSGRSSFTPKDVNNLADAMALTLPNREGGPTIFLDITSTRELDVRTGVQRVAKAILIAMSNEPPKDFRIEPVYLQRSGNRWDYFYAHEYRDTLMGRPRSDSSDNRADMQSGDAVVCLDLSGPTFLEAATSGLFLRLQAWGVSMQCIVFDLLPVTMPDVFPVGTFEGHRDWLDVISRFDSAVAISQTVANELTTWLDKKVKDFESRVRVGWFPLGADFDEPVFTEKLSEVETALIDSLGDCPTFLMVGTIEPRKGYDQALAAFTSLWNQGIRAHLVVVGKPGWSTLEDNFRSNIPEIEKILREHPEANHYLHWVGQASDILLEELYARSQCLLAASYGEGFGLPLIEAAHHGLPILARDIAVFREVAGAHATYFVNGSAEDLATGVRDWLAASAAGETVASASMPYLSWAESAKRLTQVLLSNRAASS
ncbi:MAG: glycosyltransferase [Actinobacteria bacterium]|uniref:Unannotated protein n=1 Tax=freshwater metagenome TaxID=449393 RepID=A0A6J7FCD1_9ZZZZ|nr:glycosyltransferase [Actinomycetota bacterium]